MVNSPNFAKHIFFTSTEAKVCLLVNLEGHESPANLQETRALIVAFFGTKKENAHFYSALCFGTIKTLRAYFNCKWHLEG